ncbi:MAG: Sir2 histone deacetylase Hst2 [Caeruleum heppii]|nr:MAG: Sir2 histone deacetylase Hst2 [Caeruleum heppii]
MGQEASTLVDEKTPPQTLEKRDVASISKYIKSDRVRRIVVMTGAGISTSAGIPDFRSPDTGLYANLARLNLPYAEAVFDISYFRQNPLPFYTLAHDLYPGSYRPTLAHSFIRLLHDKGLLLKLFTQNIDCLEREAGIPKDMIVEAHGSFATHSCIECKKGFPEDQMKKAILAKEVPHCVSDECPGLVKPDIVFFGEQLPEAFHTNRTLPMAADLCIVMGTSLSVQPFASLPGFCKEGVPRVLVNSEQVGGLGSRADDVLILEDCDAGVAKLAAALGWKEELERLQQELNPQPVAEESKKTKDELVEEEVEKLTRDVESALKLTDQHNEDIKKEFGKNTETAEAIRLEGAGDVANQLAELDLVEKGDGVTTRRIEKPSSNGDENKEKKGDGDDSPATVQQSSHI